MLILRKVKIHVTRESSALRNRLLTLVGSIWGYAYLLIWEHAYIAEGLGHTEEQCFTKAHNAEKRLAFVTDINIAFPTAEVTNLVEFQIDSVATGVSLIYKEEKLV
ncbi:hypothetical protein CDAR_469651 [Caerostris darwini]|uniref:Uncharacterized protein n=1 Tax=Caerostris darwini TaxID=1538125 RepID=A0AAV4RSP5_9ARAC|nr:hypothetical protein CDAR_469651 [Caerostris darwini]